MSLKTRKSITKRFRVTKTGKIMRRAAGQDHFNAREPGRVTRAKRRDRVMAKVDANVLKHFI